MSRMAADEAGWPKKQYGLRKSRMTAEEAGFTEEEQDDRRKSKMGRGRGRWPKEMQVDRRKSRGGAGPGAGRVRRGEKGARRGSSPGVICRNKQVHVRGR